MFYLFFKLSATDEFWGVMSVKYDGNDWYDTKKLVNPQGSSILTLQTAAASIIMSDDFLLSGIEEKIRDLILLLEDKSKSDAFVLTMAEIDI